MFKSISALSRGILKKKKGRDTIHFHGDSTNTELLFQTIHSLNQLSIYGAGGELVTTIRPHRGRKGTSQFICEQEDVDEYTTLRSTTLGVSSDNGTW